MLNRYVPVMAIAIFLFAGCASLKQTQPVLNGMIYDFENEPVTQVQLSVKNGPKTTSDIYGHFRIPDLLDKTTYEITFTKKGYETRIVQLEYFDVSQILYVQLYSAEQLLSLAEKSVSSRDYAAASGFLDRAEAAGGSPVAVGYMRAVVSYSKADWASSVAILNDLLDKGYTESYLYLFLADLYQYKLVDTEKAKKNLGLFLGKTYDPQAAARLAELNRE
jgi:hypothetical protein